MNLLQDHSHASSAAVTLPAAGREPLLPTGRSGTAQRPTYLEDATKEPWRFDFFAMLRRLERTFPQRPRIGDSASLREDFVLLGQDPFLDFPASNLARVEQTSNGRVRVQVKFLGLMGPQGALPSPPPKRHTVGRRCATRRLRVSSTS
jgi:predicted component of type VI protein secretion system